MPSKLNLTGHKFERLSVIEEHGRDKHGFVIWKCICDCNKVILVSGTNLKSGHTKSCGCYKNERTVERLTKHGRASTKNNDSRKVYAIWASMKARCSNPNNISYHYYGGRGIQVCDRWKTFENFLADMGEKPDNYSLERVDVNGDYNPQNCIWILRSEQSLNTRRTIYLTLDNLTYPLMEWSRKIGISADILRTRKRLGWTDEEALLYPSNRGVKMRKKRSLNYW